MTSNPVPPLVEKTVLTNVHNATTCFITRTENQFTMRFRTARRSRPESKTKWTRFQTTARITVNVKHPKYLKSPTVNLYATGLVAHRNENKAIANYTLEPDRILSHLSLRDQEVFITELQALTVRQGLPVDWDTIVNKSVIISDNYPIFSPRHQKQVAVDYSSIVKRIAYPLLNRMVPSTAKKISTPQVLSQLLRAHTLESFLDNFKFTGKTLTKHVSALYNESRLTYSALMALAVMPGVYTETEILGALETFEEHFTADALLPYPCTVAPAQIRGVLRKTSCNVFVDACLTKDSRVFPKPETLTFWGKHYRQLKPVEPKLTGLDDETLKTYVHTHVNKNPTETELLSKLNSLNLVKGSPLPELLLPDPFKVLFTQSNRGGNHSEYITRVQAPFVISGSFLDQMLKKYATTGSLSTFNFRNTGWVGLINFLEELDTYVVGLFKKTGVVFTVEKASQIVELLNYMNKMFRSARFTGKVPLNVLKLHKMGFPLELAANLVLNKHSYKEIVNNCVVDGEFFMVQSFVYDVYPCPKRFELVETKKVKRQALLDGFDDIF